MPKRGKPSGVLTDKELKRQRLRLVKSLGLPKKFFVIKEKGTPKGRVIVVEKPVKPKKYILQDVELDEPEEQMEMGEPSE
jgi:hypothetical protein